jgi:protein-S-isoprenylcysteine O-methyltransferase Ste14
MAKALNQSRMTNSKLALAGAFLIVLSSRQYWNEDMILHEAFEILGTFLVGICAMGRVYATAFLGGHKNDQLVTNGIYSVMRNPLYFFTLLGITGVAFISNHPLVMVGLPLFFYILYARLISREEAFLSEKFGQEYKSYKESTPALFPSFKHINSPETFEMKPKYITKAFWDAIWWFSALPLIETVEYLQESGIVPAFKGAF